MASILPFLRARAHDGQVIEVRKGPLAATLQRTFGDVLISTDGERVWAVEVKVERRWTGNLFLETWSNRNLVDRASHTDRGSAPGWLVTSRADVLLYAFLDTEGAVLAPMFRLQRWAFASGTGLGVYAFPERCQRASVQRNDSWGRCVPVDVIVREAGGRRVRMKDDAQRAAVS